MKTNFKYLQKMFFLLVMGFSICAMQACSDEDDDSSKVLENGNVLINGHEAVDLGLSVKWATCNVGSYTPEGCGEYYAWGETETKSDYSWETYKWCEGTIETFTKYCTDDGYGKVDNRTVLTSSDDVATVKWGKKWRIPTKEEIEELIDECTWTMTTQNGMNGYLVVGPSGKSIFLPAAGGRLSTSLYGRGSSGYYWSATLNEDGSRNAYYLGFGDGYYYRNNSYRSDGFTVRSVTE